MEAVFFDVGLGDCTLISSKDEYVLVDGGAWFPDSLKVYIKEKQIKRISSIICTHYHEDHIGGLIEVMKYVNFDRVYCNTEKNETGNKFFAEFLELTAQNKSVYSVPKEGECIHFGDATLTFYNTESVYNHKSGNEKSLICLVECNNKRILLPGDAGDNIIGRVIRNNVDLRADVFHLPHHGMNELSDDTIKLIAPKIGIISYARNSYGQISDSLVKKLKKADVSIYQTNEMGDIYCQIENDAIDVKCSIKDVSYENKRLLFLGANSETINHVNTAKKMGIYSVVIDHIPGSPAKGVADAAYDIDGKDVASIIDLFHKEKMDGVLIGVADPLLPAYMEVTRKLMLPTLPSYGNEKQGSFFTDKKAFKKICKEAGLCVIPEYYCGDSIDEVNYENIVFPCVVKPTVSRGGNAVALCKKIEDIQKAFPEAKEHSDDGTVSIEAFMDCVDVYAHYFFCNGVPYLLSVTDRISLNDNHSISPVTYGNIYPSEVTEEFIRQCDSKLKTIFQELQLRNGVFSTQVFWDGENFYPYDPAGILGAELTSPIFPNVLGIDLIEHFIKYSLTGNMQCNAVPCAGGTIPDGGCAATIWILLKPGKIEKIKGLENVAKMDGVIGMLQRLQEGSKVKQEHFQTEKSVLARIWIKAATKENLFDLEKRIRAEIKAFDDNGESMIFEKN